MVLSNWYFYKRPGLVFSAVVRGRVSAEQSGAYQTITSNRKMEINVATLALRWLSNTPFTKVVIFSDSQPMLWKGQNGWLWHEWLPYVATLNLQGLVWIYCPEHAGLYGNKRVNILVLRAPIIETGKFGHNW